MALRNDKYLDVFAAGCLGEENCRQGAPPPSPTLPHQGSLPMNRKAQSTWLRLMLSIEPPRVMETSEKDIIHSRATRCVSSTLRGFSMHHPHSAYGPVLLPLNGFLPHIATCRPPSPRLHAFTAVTHAAHLKEAFHLPGFGPCTLAHPCSSLLPRPASRQSPHTRLAQSTL